MTDIRGYLDELAGRLAADGCTVSTEAWGSDAVLVGHRGDFRLQWFATKLHLFTVAAPADVVTRTGIEAFTSAAWERMRGRTSLLGLQTGVAVLPTLVATRVEPEAAAWAGAQQHHRFATFARPVVVDTTARTISAFTGTVTIGSIYSRHILDKMHAYFPGVL